MIRIALSGSIGMGKSTVARMFQESGIPLFDADAVVRKLQAEDADLIGAIGTRFSGTVVAGKLNRDRLAEVVLGRPDELRALEAIVHPAVQAARADFIRDHRDAPALLFEIPLLFETGGGEDFDKVIVISAPADIQRQRVLARPNMSPAKLDAILARQLPDGEKKARADFVIDTGGDLSTTEAQVTQILSCLGLTSSR